MEALYSKLYDKYNKMKTKKVSELEEFNKDQEVKFLNCISAAEDLIQHLKNENEKLHSQLNDLRSEVASIRVSKDEQCAEYQRLFMEESEKNKVLAEKVDMLKQLEREGVFSNQKDSENRKRSTPEIVTGGLSGSPAGTLTRFKRRNLSVMEAGKTIHHDNDTVDTVQGESTKDLRTEAISSETLVNVRQSQCCRRSVGRSGEETRDNGSANCLFQALVECLVGMKFSVLTQNERICLSVEHESSGYSFSLTWLEKEDGKEGELLYHVLSLGTFERVAPEWMKEAIMFSTTMCPIFFEKVSGVVRPFS